MASASSSAWAACPSTVNLTVPAGGSVPITCAYEWGFLEVDGDDSYTSAYGHVSVISGQVFAPAYFNDSGAGQTDSFFLTDGETGSGIGDPTAQIHIIVTIQAATSPITITPATLPVPAIGVLYSQQLSASGGIGAYNYSITGGSLPPGLTMPSTGLISGTPTGGGGYNFTVHVTDQATPTANTLDKTYSVIVPAPTLVLSPASPPAGAVNQYYSQQFSVSGGTAPYTYSVQSGLGSPPPGLSLSGTGLLSGTPTATGSSTFSLKYQDSTTFSGGGQAFAAQNVTITINNATTPGAPVIGTATAGDAQASVAFQPPASDGGAAITLYTVTSTPDGISATGASSPITVTGLTNGTAYTFQVTATNTAGPGSASANSNSVTPQGSQTTTFANPGSQNFGTSPTLTAAATSGLTPTFTSGTTGVCTITSGGTLTFLTAGNCTIHADQGGNGTFLPAPTVSQTFSVVTVPAVANPVSATVGYGSDLNPIPLNITGGVPTSVAVGTQAAHGAASAAGTSITYTPTAGYAGPDSFTYTATNGAGTSAPATVLITVSPPAAPTISEVTPNSGSTAGGTTVTLTGTGFTGATAVSFGGTSATGITVVNDTTITAPTPAHVAGAVAVAVTAPGGNASLPNGFTYTATPQLSINDVSMSEGNAGTTSFTFTVSLDHPAGPGGVAFDIATADNTASSGSDYLLKSLTGQTIPAGSSSYNFIVNVTGDIAFEPTETFFVNVTGATVSDGQGQGTIVNDDVAAPTLASVTPNTGLTTGGTSVTITGTGFTGTTAVTFGGTAATSVTVDSATSITATTPAGTGAVVVEVTTPSGTATLADAFTYEAAAPTLTSVAPATGPEAGGTSITITGTNLTGATAVTFGGTAATGVTVNSATSITATTPPGTGAVDVAVTTPAGTATLADAFTYEAAAPTLTSIAPDTGPEAGGTSVTITGTNLTGATAVTFGGAAATGVTVVSATSITATMPAGTGAVDVVVTTPGGGDTLADAFTYEAAAPVTLTLDPAAGPLAPGEVGAAFAETFTASGGSGNYTYAVTAGALPGGLILVADGTLSGSPTTVENASFTITASDVDVPANTGTAAYTIAVVAAPASTNAELADLAPGAGSLEPGFNAGTLSYAVSVANEIETITVTPTAADANAAITVNGQPVASGTSSQPIPLTVGPNPAQIVVTAEDGTTVRTYSVTVTRAVIVRPDPSQDPEVIGLLNAQASTARRFAQNQMTNFHRRLEQLHNEGERRASSIDVRLGITQANPSNPAEHQIDQMIAASHGAVNGDRPGQAGAPGAVRGALAYGPDGNMSSTDGATGSDDRAASAFVGPDLGPFAVWSGGFVNFGERDSGGLDLDYTMVGVSGGIDYRFSDQFVGGFGVGYGRDRTDIGENGTESRANAFSGAIYGSYKPIDNLFIDGLIGGSWMNFDSTRFVTANGDFATGSRDGSQLFGSLTAAYEFRDEVWLISPYGGVEFSRSWLDGFTENGGGIYGLTYGDQTIDTLSGVLGIRANYAFQMDWGTLTPGVRAEYVHDFQGSSRASLGYTDLGGLPYSIDVDPDARDYVTLGLSLDFQFENDMNLGLDYRTSFGGSGNQDHVFGAKLGVQF